MVNEDQFGIKMEIEYIKSEDKKEEARQNEQFTDDIIRSSPDYSEVMRQYKDLPLPGKRKEVLDFLKKNYIENSEKDPTMKKYGFQPKELKDAMRKEAKDMTLPEIELHLNSLYERGHAQRTYIGIKPHYRPTDW